MEAAGDLVMALRPQHIGQVAHSAGDRNLITCFLPQPNGLYE